MTDMLVELTRALRRIRDTEGKVCRGYEICGPDNCLAPQCEPWRANNSSYNAWTIADEAVGPSTSAAQK
jgi:hypothetical protein